MATNRGNEIQQLKTSDGDAPVAAQTPDIRRLATPRPWRIGEYEKPNRMVYTAILAGDYFIAEEICGHEHEGSNKANAALIVRAVNRDHHFDALMEVLEKALTVADAWIHGASIRSDDFDDLLHDGGVEAIADARAALAAVRESSDV